MLALSSIIAFSACAKEVDCDIDLEHVHLYLNDDEDLSRYIESEKEYVGNFYKTDTYYSTSDTFQIISDNNLYIISDNIDYLTEKMGNYHLEREAYVYDYIYGSYYGYEYGYDYSTNSYTYGYGLKTGYHWDYEWQNIDLDEYTDDKVRDITYQFKFYKINDDGTLISKLFNSLDEVDDDYKYFKPGDLVKKNISDSYYLSKEKQKVKSD